jgi:hypothetical protein
MFNLARALAQSVSINGIQRALRFDVKLCAAVAVMMGSIGIASGQITSLAPAQVGRPTQPITAKQRFNWAVVSTVGPASLLGGMFSAGWGTLFNSPREYGPHWAGFGDRYGMRLTGLVTSNAMEAGLGAIWHEDPRYWRKGGDAPFGNRIKHIFKYTFLAVDETGAARPAYARYIAYAGNNFLSNTWREQSEADTSDALERTATAFLGRVISNTWVEFWPDVNRKVFHRRRGQDVH